MKSDKPSFSQEQVELAYTLGNPLVYELALSKDRVVHKGVGGLVLRTHAEAALIFTLAEIVLV